MKWILGLSGGAILAAIVAFSLMNPAAALKLWSNISGFVQEKLAAVFKWARDPQRNWWKISCLTFAGFFSVAMLYANDQREEVILITTTLTEKINVCELATKGAEVKAKTNHQILLICQTELKKVVGEDQDTDAMNAEAVAQARAAQAVAEKRLRDWKARERTNECKDALKVLETKCNAFSDY